MDAATEIARINAAADHYQVIGVAVTADEPTIKKAYRKLAVLLHPDKNPAPEAHEAFKRVRVRALRARRRDAVPPLLPVSARARARRAASHAPGAAPRRTPF